MKTRQRLSHLDRGRELTLEEFLDAEYEQGYKYEIIEGRLDVSPEADSPHQYIRDWLFLVLHAYSVLHPEALNRVAGGGRVFVPHTRRRTTAPEPDLLAFRGFPLDRHFSEVSWRDVSPVLVVEVISPGSADKDLVRNRRLYLRVPSILEYWMIDTRASLRHPSLIALRRDGRRWAEPINVPFGGSYTTPLLPGFALAIDPQPGAA